MSVVCLCAQADQHLDIQDNRLSWQYSQQLVAGLSPNVACLVGVFGVLHAMLVLISARICLHNALQLNSSTVFTLLSWQQHDRNLLMSQVG